LPLIPNPSSLENAGLPCPALSALRRLFVSVSQGWQSLIRRLPDYLETQLRCLIWFAKLTGFSTAC
jgi:hypothetical protein